MLLRLSAAIFAMVTVVAFSAPADAQSTTTTTKRVTQSRAYDRTIVRTRDEDGRTRTKIIVQRRSFLDPGTQVFPGENRYNDGPALVYQPTFSSGADRGTITDRGQPPLPGRFELPFNSNPIERP